MHGHQPYPWVHGMNSRPGLNAGPAGKPVKCQRDEHLWGSNRGPTDHRLQTWGDSRGTTHHGFHVTPKGIRPLAALESTHLNSCGHDAVHHQHAVMGHLRPCAQGLPPAQQSPGQVGPPLQQYPTAAVMDQSSMYIGGFTSCSCMMEQSSMCFGCSTSCRL